MKPAAMPQLLRDLLKAEISQDLALSAIVWRTQLRPRSFCLLVDIHAVVEGEIFFPLVPILLQPNLCGTIHLVHTKLFA